MMIWDTQNNLFFFFFCLFPYEETELREVQ